MKKLILLTAAILVGITASAQSKFELQPSGVLTNSENKEADYLTFDFEGNTKDQIYSKALVAISSIYASPKDVLSTVENELISINGIGGEAILLKTLGMKQYYDIRYTLALRFKDGKMRVDSPSINSIVHPNPQATIYRINVPQSIFNKKGEIKNEDTKLSIESFFNNLIEQITSSMANKTDSNW